MKRIIVFLVSLSLMISVPVCANADDSIVDESKIKAKSVVLMDMDSREVLYAKNENDELSPASVTKIMSLLLVMEAIESKKINLEDMVTASKDAVAMGGSQIWLEVGEKMTVNELLKAVIIASANDACTALGELVGGSSVGFVKMMNDKAKALGLKHTNFENCTGLDDDVKAHYSSAYDLAVISCELMKYKLVEDYTTVWLDTLREGKTELNNTNKLINSYQGMTGLKTGTTSNAGFCISATASKEDMNLVAVVLGSSTSQERFDTASYLLDVGFANYQSVKPSIDENKIKSIKVNRGVEISVLPVYDGTNKILVKKNSADIKYEYDIKKSVTAPVKKGDELGFVIVKAGEKTIAKIKLYSPKNIEKISFKFVLLRLLEKI